MKNNKGFSLVELIVAFAILAIAGTAVYGLMSTSTNHFTKTGNDVGLQYEQQVVVNRLRDVLMGASDAISYDDSSKTLVIYNQEDMGPIPGGVGHEYKYNVTKIYKKTGSTELKQVSKIFDTIADVDASSLSEDDSSLLGENVKDISFDLSDIAGGKIGFTIWFEDDGRELSSKQVVSLRNKVLNSDNPSEIFTTSSGFENSFIRYITIYRGDVALTPSDTTEIAIHGFDSVSVDFDYEVTANEYSGRTYNCVWSFVNNIEGWSVDANGMVRIDASKVRTGDENVLKVTSVDDITKYQTVNIRISDYGYYPFDLSVEKGSHVDYDGYREYNIHPVITYKNGQGTTYTSNDGTLCNWVVQPTNGSLPKGCTYDPATGKFTALSTANGLTVRFTATVKAPCADGTYLTRYVDLEISGVGEYVANQKLSLHGPASIYNCRGKSSVVMASWENSTKTDFIYHWRVSAYDNGSWDSTGTDLSKFSKTISFRGGSDSSNQNNQNIFTEEQDGYYASKKGFGYIFIEAKPWLDWKNTYQVKVECYATDSEDNRYGIGNDVDENYTGPVEMLVTYEPVKIILSPVSVVKAKDQAGKPFVTGPNLKRSSTGELNSAGTEYEPSTLYGGNTVRTFEIYARGVYYSAIETGNVNVSNAEFHFYNSAKNPVTNEGVKDLFDNCDYVYYPNNTVAFQAYMNGKNGSNAFLDYYDDFLPGGTGFALNKPVYMQAIYKASDDYGNIVDTYYQTGDDYLNDSDIENTRIYLFNIVYEADKLKDPNYIEVLK